MPRARLGWPAAWASPAQGPAGDDRFLPQRRVERVMGQLGRILLSRSSGSSDEQSAAPGEGDDYGELMDEIDRLTEPISARGTDPPDR